ncbi:MAG TPA: hypothetical protein VG944_13475 [Fimbriimonas sp.]|nr:hypothetical protein [Fimbriimonas sp.]
MAQRAKETQKAFEKEGLLTVAVPLSVDEINAYCESEGLENNGAARAQFVHLKLSQLGQSGSSII